jgi:exodeoxyribonuclease-3
MTALITSWNVNGIRSILKKGYFANWVTAQKPAIICLQESKAKLGQYSFDELSDLRDYTEFSYSAQKAGYSGTIVLSKPKPLSVQYGMGVGTGDAAFDNEGRVITLKFARFTLVNVYRPSTTGSFEVRHPFRQRFDTLFTDYLKTLKQESPLIVCGDHNVAFRV